MALVVVSGAVANKLHQGGEAWVRLSYLLGLRRLGYHVHFVEQIAPGSCVGADGAPAPFERSANRAYFREVMEAFGLAGCSTLLPISGGEGGAVPPELFELAAAADALLNVSGHLTDPLLRRFRRRAFLDIDPGFTQIWHAQGEVGARLAGHTHYFTIGESIGSVGCLIPTGGIPWRTTRPPVVLSEWPAMPAPVPPVRFTTVANWRGSYGPVQLGDRTFGLKVHEFRKVLELPSRRPEVFEVALNIHAGDGKDVEALRAGGWRLTDPVRAASTPQRFRRYVQESGAEFSVAQGVYVQTGSGWFSDRTTRYLASGRPVLVQDTGFSRYLPTGEGLVGFRTPEEAVRGAESIAADYERHCRAARALAEDYFDSDAIVSRLLEEIGVAP